MKLLIHDLPPETFESLLTNNDDTTVIDASGKYAPCRGCFNCWLKTPGYCFIKDEIQHVGALFGKCREIIIVSRNCYGGYSGAVKKVIDRSISASLPFFTYRGGDIHHRYRYRGDKSLKVILYGDFIETERETASVLVEANRLNLGCRSAELLITENPEDIGGLLS